MTAALFMTNAGSISRLSKNYTTAWQDLIIICGLHSYSLHVKIRSYNLGCRISTPVKTAGFCDVYNKNKMKSFIK